MKEIKLPPEYSYIDQSYGTVKWSVRGIYEGYAGWFDEKPSSMYDQPGESIGGDLIDLAGERALLDLVRAYIVNKDYIRGLHLVELIIAARPGLEEALALKRTILNGLKSGSTNYIERIWLNYGLSQCNGLR
jgi:alkyl sulfatase BDS1-like metallo-beta-lactamase superfamily hydrolase